MSPKHAGESRIADQALIDQTRACVDELKPYVLDPSLPLEHKQLARWAGRAFALLEQIGELGQ